MRNLLLLLILLTLLGAAAYFAMGLLDEEKDPSNNNNNTGQNGNDNGNNNGNNNGGNNNGNNNGGNNGGNIPLPPTDPTDNSGNGDTDGDDEGELPSTALINDTVDRVLIGIGIVLMAIILLKTNIVGKLFFPASEYFHVDFFGVADNDFGKKARLRHQLETINKAISQKD